jgi:hypothetical protein
MIWRDGSSASSPIKTEVTHYVSRIPSATDDDRIGLAGEAQGSLGLDDDPVHRRDPWGRAHDQCLQFWPLDTIEHGGGDERIEFVEALEGKHRDPHTASQVEPWGSHARRPPKMASSKYFQKQSTS